jgi:hypothetical protein
MEHAPALIERLCCELVLLVRVFLQGLREEFGHDSIYFDVDNNEKFEGYPLCLERNSTRR